MTPIEHVTGRAWVEEQIGQLESRAEQLSREAEELATAAAANVRNSAHFRRVANELRATLAGASDDNVRGSNWQRH